MTHSIDTQDFDGELSRTGHSEQRRTMKDIIGKVVSTKMAQTAVVAIERQTIHPLYKKIIRRTKRVKVHNEDESLKVGDTVKIAGTRPLSKEKHFKVVKKV